MFEDKRPKMIPETGHEEDISDYLTEEERRKLLASLHRVLVWVGVKEPEECKIEREALVKEMEKFHMTEKDLPPEVHVDKCTVELHHLIWRLLNEKEITDEERVQIDEMIDLLEKKEKGEEEVLLHEKLTHAEARQIYNEAAGVLRSILDLKDLVKRREREVTSKTAKEKAKEIRDFADRYMEWETKL
jgi:hypothetical protein